MSVGNIGSNGYTSNLISQIKGNTSKDAKTSDTKGTEAAKDTGVVYEPSVKELEDLPIFEQLKSQGFGEIPIQIGYCNGHNNKLNAVEYHRTSEINIGATDMIVLLGLQQDIKEDYTYDTSLIEAFLIPKGVGVEFFATTLHYAPCSANEGGFRGVVVLPKGTNLPLSAAHEGGEDGHRPPAGGGPEHHRRVQGGCRYHPQGCVLSGRRGNSAFRCEVQATDIDASRKTVPLRK